MENGSCILGPFQYFCIQECILLGDVEGMFINRDHCFTAAVTDGVSTFSLSFHLGSHKLLWTIRVKINVKQHIFREIVVELDNLFLVSS